MSHLESITLKDYRVAEPFKRPRVSVPIRMPYEDSLPVCGVSYSSVLSERLKLRAEDMGPKQLGEATQKMAFLLQANHGSGVVRLASVVEFLVHVTHAKHVGPIQNLVRAGLNPFHDNSLVKQEMIEERHDKARDIFLAWLDEGPNVPDDAPPVEEVRKELLFFIDLRGKASARRILARYKARKLSDVSPCNLEVLLLELEAASWACIAS